MMRRDGMRKEEKELEVRGLRVDGSPDETSRGGTWQARGVRGKGQEIVRMIRIRIRMMRPERREAKGREREEAVGDIQGSSCAPGRL